MRDFRSRHPRLDRAAETPAGRAVRKAGFSLVEHGYALANRRRERSLEGRFDSWRDADELSRAAIERGAIQKPSEFASLLRMASERRPQTVLEIGTASGGTIFGFAHAAAEDALLVSVDLADDSRFPETYDEQTAERIHTYAGPDQTLHLLQGDSHDPRTALAVAELLDGRSVDLLFIDGDHDTEGVTRDWLDYSPLVREGGLVAFHDIVDHRREDVGVHLLWKKISPRYAHHELIDPGHPADPHPWAGIGVLEMSHGLESAGGLDDGDVGNVPDSVTIDGDYVDLPRS